MTKEDLKAKYVKKNPHLLYGAPIGIYLKGLEDLIDEVWMVAQAEAKKKPIGAWAKSNAQAQKSQVFTQMHQCEPWSPVKPSGIVMSGPIDDLRNYFQGAGKN